MKRNLSTLYNIVKSVELNEVKLGRLLKMEILNTNLFNEEWLAQTFLNAAYENFSCLDGDDLEQWFETYGVSSVRELAEAFCLVDDNAVLWLRHWYGYHDLVVIAEQEDGLDTDKVKAFVKAYRSFV